MRPLAPASADAAAGQPEVRGHFPDPTSQRRKGPSFKLIEISDDQGVMLDLIQVPEDRMRLIAKHSS